MKEVITMSSKGQFTLPAAIRNAMQLQAGDTMKISYDAQTNQAMLRKTMTLEELSRIASSYIKPGTKPLLNVDEFYQKHRKPRI